MLKKVGDNTKYTIEQCKDFAKSKGGECLSSMYVNSKTKMQWKCKDSHIWNASFGNIRSGFWCPECAGTKKHTLDDCKKFAENKNGKCLSTKYVDANTSMQWMCGKGHIWNTTFDCIKNRKTWCPYCAGQKNNNIDVCRNIAKSRGGDCLSPEYINGKINMTWKCKKGHIWDAKFNDIKNDNNWCPYCSGRRNTIEICHQYAKNKDGECLSKKYINNKKHMTWKCKEGHTWNASFSSIKHNNSWCPYCDGQRNNTIELCRQYANERNGKCLESIYKNSRTKMIWECSKGHRWKADFSSIKNNDTWCLICAGIKPLTLEDCHKLAKEKNGFCLSDTYINNQSKLTWQCDKDHIWETSYNNIKRGTWCPICAYDKIAKSSNNSFVKAHWKTNEEIICIASYESKTVDYLNKNKIDYKWQDEVFKLSTNKTYRPDLYLINEDKWVEIKGYMRKDAQEKWDEFHTLIRPNSELWDKTKLKELQIL